MVLVKLNRIIYFVVLFSSNISYMDLIANNGMTVDKIPF